MIFALTFAQVARAHTDFRNLPGVGANGAQLINTAYRQVHRLKLFHEMRVQLVLGWMLLVCMLGLVLVRPLLLLLLHVLQVARVALLQLFNRHAPLLVAFGDSRIVPGNVHSKRLIYIQGFRVNFGRRGERG